MLGARGTVLQTRYTRSGSASFRAPSPKRPARQTSNRSRRQSSAAASSSSQVATETVEAQTQLQRMAREREELEARHAREALFYIRLPSVLTTN